MQFANAITSETFFQPDEPQATEMLAIHKDFSN